MSLSAYVSTDRSTVVALGISISSWTFSRHCNAIRPSCSPWSQFVYRPLAKLQASHTCCGLLSLDRGWNKSSKWHVLDLPFERETSYTNCVTFRFTTILCYAKFVVSAKKSLNYCFLDKTSIANYFLDKFLT